MSQPVVFIPLFIASLLFFAWSCYRRLGLVTAGAPESRPGEVGERINAAITFAFGQKRVLAGPFGINHAILFWSFLILLVANGEFLINGMFPGIGLEALPAPLHHTLAFVFDLVSLAVLVCVAVAAVRRIVAPPFAEARTGEAFVILGLIGLLMVAWFGLHGAETAMGKDTGMPISALVARALPVTAPLASLVTFFWWLHALVLLGFMNYLPHSKHMHILTAIPNCFFRSLEQPNTQPREEFEPGRSYGASSTAELSWKDLLDSFSCTECGRCQNACPAAATGKPLNPRGVIHEIKMNLLNGGGALIGEGAGKVGEGAIWSCTTCGACMAACPVFIEQMPKLVKLRRHLVQMKSDFPEELLNLFENMENRANPWGIAPSERTKWCSTMDVKPYEQGKTEYLLFVGCAGAFDSRQKHVTVALATVLDAAGVSWGILGKEEKCCGDSLRRLGNEFVFNRMAEENVKLFRDKGVSKIVTQCPHCFSTLKNDYRQYGLEVEVFHHTELIDRLIAAGKLPLDGGTTAFGKTVFHDSCYLGRHNGVYREPRSVIAAATGSTPAELERTRDNSFCCGAGGGRMWMEEHEGSRINLNRVEEALKEKPDTICVSCPYCMTMVEDGLKDLKAEVKVKDVAEVVAEGLAASGARGMVAGR